MSNNLQHTLEILLSICNTVVRDRTVSCNDQTLHIFYLLLEMGRFTG